MKRRTNQQKKPDWEQKQIHQLTTVSKTKESYRDDLLADKRAKESQISEALRERNSLLKSGFRKDHFMVKELDDRIKVFGSQLRSVKAKLARNK